MSDQPHVLSRIVAAFEPYLKSPDEVHDIRVKLAEYLGSLVPQIDASASDLDAFTIPDHITGIRRRYLQAYRDNLKAKLECAQVRERVNTVSTSRDNTNDSALMLKTHCELLKLRKQYQKYRILSRHLAEAGAVANQNQIFDGYPKYESGVTDSNDADAIDNSFELNRARELTRNLEVAVVQANHQLKRERQLLENVRSRGPDPENASSEAKLRALLATKAELTTWIEDSLSKCDISTDDDTAEVLDGKPQLDSTDYVFAIEEQYEKYLKVRTELLDVASAVMKPPPSTTLADSAITQPARTTPQAKPVTVKTPTWILPYIDSHYIPLLQHSTTLAHSGTQLDQLTSKHNQDLYEQLLRLNDESHLLPSYPILKQPNQQLDETEKLLHAWKFAMEAAGTATAAGVERQVGIGEKAIEQANGVLDGQQEMSEIWKKLETA